MKKQSIKTETTGAVKAKKSTVTTAKKKVTAKVKSDTLVGKTVQFTFAGNPDCTGKVIEQKGTKVSVKKGKVIHTLEVSDVTVITLKRAKELKDANTDEIKNDVDNQLAVTEKEDTSNSLIVGASFVFLRKNGGNTVHSVVSIVGDTYNCINTKTKVKWSASSKWVATAPLQVIQ